MPRRLFFIFEKKIFFTFYEYFSFSFSLTWDPMGAKTSKRYSSLKSLLNPFKLFLKFLLSGPHKSTLLGFWNFEFLIFQEFCSFSLTWDPMGAKTSKPYSSLKSVLNPFKRFLKFLLSGPHKRTVLDVWNFKFRIFNDFFNFTMIVPYGETKKPQLSRKRATIERNRVKFGPREWVFSVHRVLLTLQWLRSFWGHSVHSDFRQVCISKMAGHSAKLIEIWSSGLVFSVRRVLLTLQWISSFWGHSVHSDFRQACISKMAGRRAKRSEIWTSGVCIQCIQVLLTLKCWRSFWDHSVHFRFSNIVCLENGF